jgi:hypothetical protein
MDWDLMIPIVIIIIIVVMAAPFIIWLVTFFMRRKDMMVERPIDVHEMIYHKRKKAAKKNMRKLKLRRLVFLGDKDYPSVDYGRIVGMIISKDVAEVFTKTKKTPLTTVGWGIINLELIRDVFGRNLRVDARGFTPMANYYKPVWSSNTTPVQRLKFEATIDEFVSFIVTGEKNEELYEQNVNAMIESVSAKRAPPTLYDRDDHLSQPGAGGVNREEEAVT